MFRNESEHVVGKAKAKEKLKQKTKSPSPPKTTPQPQPQPPPQPQPVEDYSHTAEKFFVQPATENSVQFINDNVYHGQFSQALLTTASIFPTLEDRALSSFSANSSTWLRSWGIAETTATPTYSEEYLLASMSAVGMASFSTTMRAPELMTRARKDYVTALQLTNAALRSPKDVKKDSTLFAVMILGIFETVSGNTERSLGAWAEHINGAAALVKLRGPEQFSTSAGTRMFLQVTGNLMLSCIQRCTPMPEYIVELRKEAGRYMDSDNPAWRLSGIVIDFTIFRASVRECRILGPRAVINAALEIDSQFISVISQLPVDWGYNTLYTDEYPELIWNKTYHVYKEQWMAHVWNAMRTCRILLHEMIKDQLLAASMTITPIFTDEESDMRLQNSINVMLDMRTDILASIPHHTPSVLNGTPSALLEGSRSYFVLWPLFLAGSMDFSTIEIRHWTAARLRDIGETTGLRQAIVLADILISREHISSWDVKAEPHLERAQMDMTRNARANLVES